MKEKLALFFFLFIQIYQCFFYLIVLFCLKVLKSDPDLKLLLDVVNFDFNYKAINKRYEQYVLSVGEFDERIFLCKKLLFNFFFMVIIFITLIIMESN